MVFIRTATTRLSSDAGDAVASAASRCATALGARDVPASFASAPHIASLLVVRLTRPAPVSAAFAALPNLANNGTRVPTIGAVVAPSTAQEHSSLDLVHFHSSNFTANAFHVDARFSSNSPFRQSKGVGRWFEPLALQDDASHAPFDVSAFKSLSLNTPSLHDSDTQQELDLKYIVQGSSAPEQDPSLLLTLSDKDPHAIWDGLCRVFPHTPKMGLITPMTPFLTGLTHTLLHDTTTHEAGLTGLAFTPNTTTSASPPTYLTTTHKHLTPFGPVLTITACRGNIITRLDDGTATHQILRALAQQHGGASVESHLARGQSLYLRLEESGAVYRIVAGDLAKGNLALDRVRDLEAGMRVQFLYQDLTQANGEAFAGKDGAPGIRLETIPEAEGTVLEEAGTRESEVVISDHIAMHSDAGIVYAEKGAEFEVCRVPYSSVEYYP
ncbi:hypothetical protein BC830DRAFT_818187 [Chytriomyces sp. MP71]|nr:hypothetical protein BC830DRAFT_818187 [Chytriomyces sp. MP71]